MSRKYRRAAPELAIGCVLLALAGCRGSEETAGTVTAARVPDGAVAARATDQARAAADLVNGTWSSAAPARQILFGDLHVHTRFSGDALWRDLPFVTGAGVGSVADACDFARFCADLDFWALTDHAETLSPAHWGQAAEAIRACNASGGDAAPAHSAAFLGWEWTHDADPRYPARGVVLRDTAAEHIPARPISAPNRVLQSLREPETLWQRLRLPLSDVTHAQRYLDFSRFREALRDIPRCPSERDVRELPADCQEVADTPARLSARLDQWNSARLVVQHGAGEGAQDTRALTITPDDAAGLDLFEIYSGAGSAEEYRPWRAARSDRDGGLACAAPTDEYVPCCWQAGEVARRGCGAISAAACEQRVQAARAAYLRYGLNGTRADDDSSAAWLDCGQCRDCFNPTFMYQPKASAQYLLALRGLGDATQPRRALVGFVAGSDSHRGRPGTGYKERRRLHMTDAAGLREAAWRTQLEAQRDHPLSRLWGDDPDRAASFRRTGGLVAVHAESRDRAAIWDALRRREVYATSGDRILLWFDLVNAPEGRAPMGAQVALRQNPVFQVRAIGAALQQPGCSDETIRALGRDRVGSICAGECFHPTTERRVIARIDVIRVRPQQYPGEPVEQLIEDPWRRLPCPGDPAGCVVELRDPEFVAAGRDAVYYARAVQEPSPAINAGGLRCTGDRGACDSVHPCYADERTPADDDCLALNEERAWSSPIYVDVDRDLALPPGSPGEGN